MTDRGSLTDRLAGLRGARSDDDPADGCDDCGCYGYLRGTRDRAIMLDVRRLGGRRESFAYATLERASFDPSDGLTLHFLGVRVVLRGRNLAAASAAGVSLLEALLRHRVPWVQEVEELRGGLLPADAVVLTGVEVIEPG